MEQTLERKVLPLELNLAETATLLQLVKESDGYQDRCQIETILIQKLQAHLIEVA